MLWLVCGVVSDHAVQDVASSPGQADQRLRVVLALVPLALVVGA